MKWITEMIIKTSNAGDSNESEEPVTKKFKPGDQQCDDEVFVTIEDIEPNEPAKPVITTTVPVAESWAFWDSEIWVVTEMNAELGLYDTPIENLHAAISVRKVERIYFALFPLVIETTTVEREC